MATPQKPPVQVPLVWCEDPDLRTIYAHHVLLTRQDDDAFLTFGEIRPVVPAGSPPDKVQIHPVARIALSKAALVRMTKLLRDNVDLPDVPEAKP